MNYFTGFDEAVVVDVETTGLNPRTERVVSVGLIRADFSQLKERPDGLHGKSLSFRVNPQRPIPSGASRIHGITDEDVANEAPFSEIAEEIREFIGTSPVIAHNASFDKRFLNAEFERAGVKTLAPNRSYCTMRRFQEYNGGQRKGSKLVDAIRAFGREGRVGSVHDALEDAQLAFTLAAIFYRIDNAIEAPERTRPPSPRSDDRREEKAPAVEPRKGRFGWGTVIAAFAVGLFLGATFNQ